MAVRSAGERAADNRTFRWVGVINMLAGFNHSSLHPLLAQHVRPTALANSEGAMWDEVSKAMSDSLN
jgi:hypothetical protein